MKRNLGPLIVCLLTASGLSSQQRPEASFSPYVDEAGDISRPRDYRDNWTHLGTYFVIGESQSGHSMHSVYTQKRYLDAYNRSRLWPDGAVLVKEVMRTAGDQLTTGASNWATDPDVWFVIVKDAKGRFPENRLWGDGWGWALFKADAPDTQVATNYKKDCLNCHVPAKETDLVYVQGYPSIHNQPEAPAAKSGRPMMAAVETVDFAGGSAQQGAAIFAEVCAICHSIEGDRVKVGPSLAVIARNNKLPSGVDGSPENILRQINNGGGGMPAFAVHLGAQQKADVISYVRGPQ